MSANHNDRVQSFAQTLRESGPEADVDQDTRKMLTKNKEEIEKSNKLIWATITIAIIGIILIIIAWITLYATASEPATVINNNNSSNSDVQNQLFELQSDLQKLNDTIKMSEDNLTTFDEKLENETRTIITNYTGIAKKLKDLKAEQDDLKNKLNSATMIYNGIYEKEKCGKTTKVKGKIGELNCDNDICNCYGDICLVNGNCSHGNVYVSGTPVCNTMWGAQGGRVTCKALGFYDNTIRQRDSDSSYYKTDCQGYESKISDCTSGNWEKISQGNDCKNGGHAYVKCKTISGPIN